jgi:predicted aspartyl protease
MIQKSRSISLNLAKGNLIELEFHILSRLRKVASVDAILDTAFTGDIALPIDLAFKLDLNIVNFSKQHVEFADGDGTIPVSILKIEFFGIIIGVQVCWLEDGSDALVGTRLLERVKNITNIDFVQKIAKLELE